MAAQPVQREGRGKEKRSPMASDDALPDPSKDWFGGGVQRFLTCGLLPAGGAVLGSHSQT